MPIRPEIALAFQGPQIESPLNSFAKYSAIQNAQNQNALAQYQLSSAQRQDAQQNTTNAAWRNAVRPDGTIDRTALYQSLAAGNAGSAIPGVQKNFLEADTAEATLGKTRAEIRDKQMREFAHGMISVYDDPSDESVNAAAQRLVASGVDPKFVGAQTQQFLSIADQQKRRQAVFKIAMTNPEVRAAIEAVQPKPEKVDIGGKVVILDMNPLSATYKQQVAEATKTVTPDAQLSATVSREGQGVQIRGQDIAAATARRGQDLANEGSYTTQETTDGLVAVNSKTGAAKQVTLDGRPLQKDKPATDQQLSTAGYLSRMIAASQIINGLEQKGYTPGLDAAIRSGAEKLPAVGGAAGILANKAMTENAQKYRQAQEDWVRAKLRKESGAVIGEEEMAREITTYFPQSGDGRAVIGQKAAARKEAEKAMAIQAKRNNDAPAKADPLGIRP